MGESFNKKHMEDKSCTVLGKEYSGAYHGSTIDKMNSYTTDMYRNENGIEFGIRDDNGELVLLNLMNAEFFDTQPYWQDVDHPEESAISLATEIASKYLDNIDDYTRIIEKPRVRQKERDGITYEITYYFVVFAKKVNGYFSSDYISVKVTSKGTLASIYIGDHGVFDDVIIDDIDEKKVEQSVSDRVISAYEDKQIGVVRTNIDDQKIAVTTNGDVCIVSQTTVTIVEPDKFEINTGVDVLTVVGKKK